VTARLGLLAALLLVGGAGVFLVADPGAPDAAQAAPPASGRAWEARPLPAVTAPPGAEWCTDHCSLAPMHARNEPPVPRRTPHPSAVHGAGTSTGHRRSS
jgi:hypothetical protein